MKSPMEASESIADTAMPTKRPRMNGMVVPSGTSFMRNNGSMRNTLSRQRRTMLIMTATHYRDRREHRDRNAKAHSDRKAANRTGAEHEQESGREQRR